MKKTTFTDVGNMRIHLCPSFDAEIEKKDGVHRMWIETDAINDTFWIKHGRNDRPTDKEHDQYRDFIKQKTGMNYLYD